jgi:hypothetical protein
VRAKLVADALGDAAGAGEVTKGKESSVVEQMDAVGDGARAREIVRREDDRRAVRDFVAHEAWSRPSTYVGTVVDEE